jgi:hypothetical protein
MASIKQRIEHLFPSEKGKGPSPIAMVATFFAERRGQWLTQVDIIKLVNKKFGDSTIRKAFRGLSLPMDALDGRPFIEVESVKEDRPGGPILRGRISDAAIEKLFKTVTPVENEPPSCFIRKKRLELPPLKINDRYLPPKDIVDIRKLKSGEDYTRSLLHKLATDKLGADKEAIEKLILKMAKNQGIEFDTATFQFTKGGKEVFPEGNLARTFYKWRNGPYTKPSCVLKGHHYGPIPLRQRAFTDLAMQKLAADENRLAFSASAYIVDSRQDSERIRAIEGRVKKGDEESFKELIRVLSSEDSRYARQEAARSLGHLHDPRVIEPLVEAMLGDEYVAVRSIAAEGLTSFGYRPEFTQALNDSDPHIRRGIVEILGKIGDLRAVDSLMQALHDPDIGVQCSAANSLGKIGDSRAVDFIISKLESEDESVRHAVAEALGNIGDRRAIEALRKMRDDPSTWVRDTVIIALKKLER